MKSQRTIANAGVLKPVATAQHAAAGHPAVRKSKQPAVGNTALLACLFALSLPAQPQPAAGLSPLEPKPPSDGVIVVQVNNSQGAPLGGSLVVLRQNISGDNRQPITRHATSDSAGRARFTGLPNGGYAAQAHRAGCSLAPSNTNHSRLEGAKAEGQIQVILQRRPVITGRVVDERGTPLHNAHVQVLHLATHDGERFLVSTRGQAMTDDRGSYRLSVYRPGRYWLMAYHMEPSFPRGSAPRSTGVVFYPNSLDLLSALPADLAFDQPETTLDIALPPAARTEIAAGILSGPEGRPCTRCRYSLQRVEGPFSYELTSGGTGRAAGFDTRGLPPGQYRVYVEDQSANQGWWAIEEATLVEDRTTGLTIQTRPPVAISGRVTLEDPPAEALDLGRERSDAVSVQLNQLGRHFFGFHGGAGRRAELSLEQSEFTLGPAPPQQFRFEVLVHGTNAYLAGLTRQGRELPSAVLDFSQPGPWTNLEARVRFDLAEPQFRIPASAAPDARQPGYRLVLMPDPNENPFGREASGGCSQDGNCYTPPLPPGRYWVIVFPATLQDAPVLTDPEIRKKLEPWGREVDLAAGQNPRIELTIAPEKAFATLESSR